VGNMKKLRINLNQSEYSDPLPIPTNNPLFKEGYPHLIEGREEGPHLRLLVFIIDFSDFT
jgi:hypothetical protein